MPSKVEIINNPYMRRLQILIDGEPVSAYSGLEKFMDEPFLYWCDKILPAIHAELNSSQFSFHFQSDEIETGIMEKIATQIPYCLQYSSSGFVRNMKLTERMAKLNNLIKSNELTGFRQKNCSSVFIVPEKMSSLCSELKQIEIRNLYCNVNIIVITYNEFLKNPVCGDVMFTICEKGKENEALSTLSIRKGFLISIGEKTGFLNKTEEIICFETDINDIFKTIFNCFILGPLSDIFTDTVRTLSSDIKLKYGEEIESMVSITSRVIIKPESLTVEAGRSIQISIETDIPDRKFKSNEFIFDYKPKGIISCNGLRVEGLKPGKSTLYVYRIGENQPCAQAEFNVIKRNRIRELEMFRREIYIGEGDCLQLECSFFPADADNSDEIYWESNDENVVQVSRDGYIKGIATGDCTVYVIAENISDKCVIHVLPHIKEIVVDESDIYLLPGEAFKIIAESYPSVCIDSRLKSACLDVGVANVIDDCLMAVDYGETILVIQNEEETVRKDIRVIVGLKKEEKRSKKGWLRRLFS